MDILDVSQEVRTSSLSYNSEPMLDWGSLSLCMGISPGMGSSYLCMGISSGRRSSSVCMGMLPGVGFLCRSISGLAITGGGGVRDV